MTGPESADGRQHLHGRPIRDYQHLIALLAASSDRQGVSQRDLAARMEVDQDCVSGWLSGRIGCNRDRLFALADALGYRLALIPLDLQHTPDVTYLRGAAEALAFVRRRLAALPLGRIVNTGEWNAITLGEALTAVKAAAAELGLDEDAPASRPSAPVSASEVPRQGSPRVEGAETISGWSHHGHEPPPGTPPHDHGHRENA